MNIKDLFTPAAVAANWTEAGSNRIPYLGEGLFPARKKAGLDLSWLKGSRGLPVSLMPSAFDAKATFRDRIGLTKLETEMPFFREGYKLKERDRQELLRISESNDPYLAGVMTRIFDDANDLIEGAAVVPERMIMSLLFAAGGDAQIVIQANGVDYSYDYDPGDVWKTNNYVALSSTALWTATSTADPFANFKTMKDKIRQATGSELVTAIMNTYTFNLMAATDAVKNRIVSTAGTTLTYLTDAEVAAVVRGTSGLNIVIYDKQYKNENKTAAKFVPDGYVALIPAGALGSTWYGTTPEEADLMGSGAADVAIVNTGVALTRVVEPHPVNVNLFASEIVLPSYERMDEVGLLKVVS